MLFILLLLPLTSFSQHRSLIRDALHPTSKESYVKESLDKVIELIDKKKLSSEDKKTFHMTLGMVKQMHPKSFVEKMNQIFPFKVSKKDRKKNLGIVKRFQFFLEEGFPPKQMFHPKSILQIRLSMDRAVKAGDLSKGEMLRLRLKLARMASFVRPYMTNCWGGRPPANTQGCDDTEYQKQAYGALADFDFQNNDKLITQENWDDLMALSQRKESKKVSELAGKILNRLRGKPKNNQSQRGSSRMKGTRSGPQKVAPKARKN